jgi:hypothetical protein
MMRWGDKTLTVNQQKIANLKQLGTVPLKPLKRQKTSKDPSLLSPISPPVSRCNGGQPLAKNADALGPSCKIVCSILTNAPSLAHWVYKSAVIIFKKRGKFVGIFGGKYTVY